MKIEASKAAQLALSPAENAARMNEQIARLKALAAEGKLPQRKPRKS